MSIKFTELGQHEAWLRLSSIVKAGDPHIRLERKLTSELIKQWRERYDVALKEVFRQIPGKISQSAIDKITDSLAVALGSEFGSSQGVRDELKKYITRAYEGGKSQFTARENLSLADRRAIEVLTRNNCYWLGEHYGKHIGPKIAELTQEALRDGLGRKELAAELRAALGGQVGGYQYWDVVSSAALVRSRSFGCISGMVEAGIVEYEILAMGDERMCPICGELNGQTFSVTETRKLIERTLDIENPDDFKAAMPWHSEPPTGKNKDDLIAEGMSVPPFHGRCRCVLVAAESSETSSGALGALNDSNDPDQTRREAHAERYYEEIRRSKPEPIVRKLAERSGISLKSAQKVYRHIFINEYDFDGIQKRFDPSYEMAQSIQRLLLGENIQKHDLILVRHERLEYELMNRYGKDYDTAHRLTCRKHDYYTALIKWQKEHGG